MTNIVEAVLNDGWRDHKRVRGNLAAAIVLHYNAAVPLDHVVAWPDHEGPLIEAQRVIDAIDGVSESGTALRDELVDLAVQLLRAST